MSSKSTQKDIGTPEDRAHWDCGHWGVHPDGRVEVKRKAKVNKYPEPLPNDVILRLAYRAGRAAFLSSESEPGAAEVGVRDV